MIIYVIKIHLTYIEEEVVTDIEISTKEMDVCPLDYATDGKVGYDTYEYNHFAINQYEINKKVLLYRKNDLETYLSYAPNYYLKDLFTQNHIEVYPELYI